MSIWDHSRPVVIVVDDDHAVRNSLEFSLGVEGFAVLVYGSPRELLAAADQPACVCFVIDQNMHEMTGLDLVDQLRRRGMSAPAILITTYPNAALVERAARRDIPIVEKPLLGNTLVDCIRSVCSPSEPPRRGCA